MIRFLAGLCGGDDEPEGKPLPNVVPPVAARTDLLFGYFGSDDAQVDETRDHISLLFAAFGDDASFAARIASAGVPAILDVSDCLFTPGMPRTLRKDFHGAMVARLDAVKAAGALELVKWLYVIDEPERESNVADDVVTQACGLAKGVAAEYGIYPQTHICYGDGEDYRGLAGVDLVGIDNYGAGAEELTGQLQRLKPRLRPEQKIALYPGGASPWKQDPRPFIDYANGDQQVAAIIAFLWVNYADQLGIRNNGMADVYRSAFTKGQA